MKTADANKIIIDELQKMYGNVDEIGWKAYLNFWLGKIANKRETPFYFLQCAGEKALKDFRSCKRSGELYDNQIIKETAFAIRHH